MSTNFTFNYKLFFLNPCSQNCGGCHVKHPYVDKKKATENFKKCLDLVRDTPDFRHTEIKSVEIALETASLLTPENRMFIFSPEFAELTQLCRDNFKVFSFENAVVINEENYKYFDLMVETFDNQDIRAEFICPERRYYNGKEYEELTKVKILNDNVWLIPGWFLGDYNTSLTPEDHYVFNPRGINIGDEEGLKELRNKYSTFVRNHVEKFIIPVIHKNRVEDTFVSRYTEEYLKEKNSFTLMVDDENVYVIPFLFGFAKYLYAAKVEEFTREGLIKAINKSFEYGADLVALFKSENIFSDIYTSDKFN